MPDLGVSAAAATTTRELPRADTTSVLDELAVGPVSPPAFSGKPLFFTAFADAAEFPRVNKMRAP